MTVLGNQITERGMTVFQDQSTHSLFQTLLSLKSINQNDEELEKMLKGLLLF